MTAAGAIVVEPALVAAEAPPRRGWPLSAVVGGTLVALVVGAALLSFVWTPHDPEAIAPAESLAKPWRLDHVLGADQFGRDVASRLMVGARVTLLVGIAAVAIAALIGVPLGVLAGMRRGLVADVVMRGADIALAFPALLLAVLLAAGFGASTTTAMTAIGVATVPAFLRLTYASTLQVMSRDYIAAARASGLGGLAVARRHVLPNISSVLLVQASVTFALAILAEAGLSYLGLSTRPTVPSWGRMLREAQGFLFTAPRLSVWPGLCIAVAVLGFNLLGDGLRDRYDPRLRRP